MYQRIVVPLDGSKLAECVLPHVEAMARGLETGEVVLLSVTERIHGRTSAPEVAEITGTGPVAPVVFGKKTNQADKYLERIARQLEKKGINARTVVLLGNPAEEIAHFTEDEKVDLIIMASHGRSGPSRWAYGSVADKVFRSACVPIVMIRAPGCMAGV